MLREDNILCVGAYGQWDHQRISGVLSEEISLTIANALSTVFVDEGAEKDWNIVWKELILYRDLAIVLFYSKECDKLIFIKTINIVRFL